jgi:hypothetical protein
MDVAWDEVTPASWDEALLKQPWEPLYDADDKLFAYWLHGDCPRCQHENAINREFRLKVLLDRASGPRPPMRREVYVQCECRSEHAGRPNGETGCGARSSIIFTIPAGTNQ